MVKIVIEISAILYLLKDIIQKGEIAGMEQWIPVMALAPFILAAVILYITKKKRR